MKSIGFHASSNVIRYVVVEGTSLNPTVTSHLARPLQIIGDRSKFMRNALSVFNEVLTATAPDRCAYILSMEARSQNQRAALILPFGALALAALDKKIQITEYISPNFSKKFFKQRGRDHKDKYVACDEILGKHPPNWNRGEQLAALAAWGAL